MAEHTLTPWMTQRCGELCPDDIMIVADMGVHNGIQHISTVAKALSIRQTAEVTATNAAFIVKACNSHEALVKALEGCRGFFTANMDALFGIDHDIPMAAHASQVISRIDAALLAAREVKP